MPDAQTIEATRIPPPPTAPRPVRREQYLHRFGSTAMLMTVEFILDENGVERRRVRFSPWPGL
jgi:hypothetical protein